MIMLYYGRLRTGSAIVLAALALVGCGGGSGSSGQPIAVVAAAAITTPAPAPTPTPTPISTPSYAGSGAAANCSAQVGVNLSGAEFGDIGGQYGWSYIYPDNATLDYFHASGVTLIRLPVRWERLQPTAGGNLDAAEMGRLVDMLDRANARSLKLIVDLHNFGRYGNDALGSVALPESTLADFWVKLAGRVATHPAFAGYGLMNEPHDMPSATAWPKAAQLAVNAIRMVDRSKRIYVAGDGWSSAQNWDTNNPNLAITDPAGNFRYEAHQYFDRWTSGTYPGSYDAEAVYPTIGTDRLQPFAEFLKRTGTKGFIGEYGVPGDDPRYLDVLDGFLTAAVAAGIDTTYWSAGQWWGSYALSIQPSNGTDRPQMAVLKRHMENGNGCPL